MGLKINFSKVADSQDFGTLPLGKYPAKLHIEAYMTDAQGGFMTNADGGKVFWSTRNGDPMWKMQFEILDPKYKDRKVFDNLIFSEKGQKRVKVLYVRGGFAEGDKDEEIELEPEDLDGTNWWIDIDSHEVAQSSDGSPRESKYAFKPNGCGCETCKANAGKMVNVNARIAFAGFNPMTAAEAKKFATGGAAAGPGSPDLDKPPF